MNLYEQIAAYAGGTLSEAERRDFEARLLHDAGLKQAYEAWLQTESIVKKHAAAEENLPRLRTVLTPLTEQYFHRQPERQPSKLVSFKNMLVAAAAVAAVVLLFFLLPAGVDDYAVAPMPLAVVRGEERPEQRGAQLFNEKKYDAALPYLQQAVQTHPDDATAAFYYGVSLVKTKQFRQALLLFQPLAAGKSVYRDDAPFFAALCYYKLNDTAAALQYARQVPAGNAYFSNAKKILRKLQ